MNLIWTYLDMDIYYSGWDHFRDHIPSAIPRKSVRSKISNRNQDPVSSYEVIDANEK